MPLHALLRLSSDLDTRTQQRTPPQRPKPQLNMEMDGKGGLTNQSASLFVPTRCPTETAGDSK
eukprot:6444896-Amphidinium_carterae.2